MPATAPHIRMCLFILIGCRIDRSFIGLGFIGSSVGSQERVNLSVSEILSCLRQGASRTLELSSDSIDETDKKNHTGA